MKLILLLSTATAMIAISAFAQNPPSRPATPPPTPPPPLPSPARVAPGSDQAGSSAADAPRFDLKFPGGPVKEFVASVNKALGKPVNVVISKDAEATPIPAVEMYRVTVAALFRALSASSQREVAVRILGGGARGENTYQYKRAGFSFGTGDPQDAPDAVWTFQVNDPPAIPTDEPASGRVVQYYPVAEYLSQFSVEDITTAIEAGWKMQGEAETHKTAPPTIRFHEETKLLLCAGSVRQIEIIPQVLTGLAKMLGSTSSDNLKMAQKAKEIIIPKVEFREATVSEAIEFIRRKALESDPQKKGINIVLNEADGPADQRISLSLTDIPVVELLRLMASLAKLDLEIRDAAIVLSSSAGAAGTASAAPGPPSAFGGGGAGSYVPAGPPGSFRTPSRPPSPVAPSPPPPPLPAPTAR